MATYEYIPITDYRIQRRLKDRSEW